MGNTLKISENDILRFWAKVNKSRECWEWTACKKSFGYGTFRVRNKLISAHVFSWILMNNKTPKLCILHSCDNPGCVNPNHLYEGSKRQNTIDSVNRKRHYETTRNVCPYGHSYSGDNLMIYNGQRRCRACNKKWCLKYYYSNK